MYSAKVIADRLDRIEASAFGTGKKLREYTPDECESWVTHLDAIYDKEKGQPTRQLTAEESEFTTNELLMCAASFPYWAQRYAIIVKAGGAGGTGSMYPLLDSQAFALSRMADLEEQTLTGENVYGIRVNILKAARQVGISTLTEAIAAHRITTQNNIFGLIAADVPEQSANLFGMMERIIDGLPWWMRPVITDRVKNTEIKTDGGSNIWVGAGKSVRGTTGQRGQLGRGRSLSVIHLSEVSTWDTPEQITSALIPAIPNTARVVAIFESTAKGRGNWWHEFWNLSKSGNAFGFAPIYIPWYIEKKYVLPVKEGWIPLDTTLATARRIEETSAQWLGKPVVVTKPQLYWYEQMRLSYEGMGDLKRFIEEFGGLDDDEVFQHTGRSVFSIDVQQAIRNMAQQPLALLDIKPYREIMLEHK